MKWRNECASSFMSNIHSALEKNQSQTKKECSLKCRRLHDLSDCPASFFPGALRAPKQLVLESLQPDSNVLWMSDLSLD